MILCGFLLISVAIAWVKAFVFVSAAMVVPHPGPNGALFAEAAARATMKFGVREVTCATGLGSCVRNGPLATGERPFESCKSSTAKLPVPTTRKNLGFGGKKSGWWRTKPDYGMAHPTTATTCTHGHTEMESNHRRNGLSESLGYVRHSEGTCYNAKNRGQRK